MFDILHRIAIRATPERVHEALTEESGLAGWWTTDTKASPSIGSINQFRFHERGFNDMKVIELILGGRVKWQCVDGAPEWIGTEVSFDLSHKDGVTIVLFAQRGWREQVEFMHYCSTKWAVYLLSLKEFCEKSRGRPFPNDVDIG